ncbi:hypothetical protein QQP08_019688 [Theobroma cacao]|nr:hypothetical protein QQP08_019688 [Theobroma cacao]
MVLFIFMIYKLGSGYQAFKLQLTLLMVSLSTHSCQWLPLHQATEDFKCLRMTMRICI